VAGENLRQAVDWLPVGRQLLKIKTDCDFVAVHASEVNRLLKLIDNSRLKSKKVRVTVI